MDLVSGLEDEDSGNIEDSVVETVDSAPIPIVNTNSDEDSMEEDIISGAVLAHSVSYSGISSAITWLGENLDALADDLTEKIRLMRRRK